MEKDINLLRSKFIGITVFITAVVIVLMVRLPLFGFLIDILISVNILLALFFFIYSIFIKKIKRLTLCIYSLVLTAIFGFVLSIAVPKCVLDMKLNYDGKIVKFIASFFEGIEIKHMLITAVCIIAIAVINELFINKCTDGVIKTSNDYLQVHYKDDVLYFMDGIYGVFTLTIYLVALVNIVIILSLILMDPLLFEINIEDDFKIIYNHFNFYFPIIIGNSIVCLMPYILLSSTIRCIAIRYIQEKEKTLAEIEKPLAVISAYTRDNNQR